MVLQLLRNDSITPWKFFETAFAFRETLIRNSETRFYAFEMPFQPSYIRLQPLMTLLSALPSTSKLPSGLILPKSSVAIKLQESMFARSIMLILPLLPCLHSLKGSLVSFMLTFSQGGHRNEPSETAYA